MLLQCIPFRVRQLFPGPDRTKGDVVGTDHTNRRLDLLGSGVQKSTINRSRGEISSANMSASGKLV